MAVNSSLFYFVRHGETDWNAERRLQGQLDIALNDIGRRQSAQCASTLRGLIAARRKAPADFAFISSPLSRARETMEILRGGLDLRRDGYAVEPGDGLSPAMEFAADRRRRTGGRDRDRSRRPPARR